MKKFKEVEENRKKYHKDPNVNSVHRASLIVPEIENAKAEISFINHFLIKRGYSDVACRITAVDEAGGKITSKYFTIEDPRVYSFDLSGMFKNEGKANSYIVEFFSVKNLFIPFPAVMVNHYGEDFANTVHAYNRVLNDVFEDDQVNEVQVDESSIDVVANDNTDTFVIFNAGQNECNDKITFELIHNNDNKVIEKEINVARFNTQKISISDIFGVSNINNDAVLKIKQPKQNMFYGRMFSGQEQKTTRAFSANHSYYDSSSTKEYWDNNLPSSRVYPYFVSLENIIRIHPIMSPGILDISISFKDKQGNELQKAYAGQIESPSGKLLEVSIDELAASNDVEKNTISSFELIATPNKGNTPTRVGHQLVYQKGALPSSINVALPNPNVFKPEGKKGFSWGQIIANDQITSYIGIVSNSASKEGKAEIELTFYDESGLLTNNKYELNFGTAITMDTEKDMEKIAGDKKDYSKNIWYVVKSDNPDISVFCVSKHNLSNHCTGEHSF